MTHQRTLVLAALLLFVASIGLYAQGNFSTSLHVTRSGKNYFYGADTALTGAPAPGFESLTNVPIDHPNVACTQCHPGDGLDANGEEYPSPYQPGCVDCHATKTAGMPVAEESCYGCHGRQKTEAMKLAFTDVHRSGDNPLKCWDCHSKAELHGDDGVEYSSMLEPGAIKVTCEQCHNTDAGTLPDHSSYDPHGDALHCAACHTQSVISCYNCHFESQVESHLKRAKQPIKDFVILVNRDKDGKVGTASFQSLTYKGDSWVAFAPYHAHTITSEGRKCADCHANLGGSIDAIDDYNQDGIIKFASWNANDSTLSWTKGVVPLPADYERSFRMDFITYDGNVDDPVGPSKNWSAIGEDTWDGHQLFFATPMTKIQMAKLGFDTTQAPTAVEHNALAPRPQEFDLAQNYPNPFNPSTVIEFNLKQAETITLKIYDITGKVVSVLMQDQQLPAGLHRYQFHAQGLSSGVYVYAIESANHSVMKKMTVMK
jgi:hypothetical protein